MFLRASERGLNMPASPIRKLAPYADAAKAKGIEIFHLNIGQPDVASPQEFWDAINNANLKVLEYCPSNGLAELRKGMAESYAAMGIDVTPDQILVTTAGSEAIIFAMMSCLDPGDEIIIPEPMYANYIGFARFAGVEVVPITTRIEEDFALPPIEAFAEKIGPRTKAIIVCNPGNPTGTIYSDSQLEGLRDLALKHDLFVIADEVYREFNYSGRPVKSVLQLEGLEDRAIMIDSVSKRYSLCGARIGFMVCRNKEVNETALKYAQARLSPPTLEQIGILGALKTPQSYFDEVRAEYKKRRDVITRRISQIPGAVCPKIEGAFYATVQLPIDDADVFCQWLLEHFEHNGKTVMMAPATGFYETPGLGKSQVRIAYVLNEQRLEEAMDCLELGVRAYHGVHV